MTLDRIMELSWKELSQMDIKDLTKISDQLNRVANSRLEKIEAAGLSSWSPAYQNVKKSGGSFSTAGLTKKNQIKAEIMKAQSFISNKTSTVKGTEGYKKKIYELTGVREPKRRGRPKKEAPKTEEPRRRGRSRKEKAPEEMSEAQRKKLFRALDRLREKNAAAVHNIGSDVIIKELRRIQSQDRRTSRDRLVEELEQKYPELMEDAETRYEREIDEQTNRTDADFVFHPLSPAEEEDNPFKA